MIYDIQLLYPGNEGLSPAAIGGPAAGGGRNYHSLSMLSLKREFFPSSVMGGVGGGESECRVSDFLRPHTPTLTYPASHTAPFPSPPPTDEKMCHQGTNATFPGCGGGGDLPEHLWHRRFLSSPAMSHSELGPGHHSLKRTTNWGSSHTATRLRTKWLEEAGEVGLILRRHLPSPDSLQPAGWPTVTADTSDLSLPLYPGLV